MTTESTQAQDTTTNVQQDRHSGQQDVPFQPAKPAAPADAQNRAKLETASPDAEQAEQEAKPASGADDQKPEAEAKEAERKLSRRQRQYQRERDARVRAETERDFLRQQLEAKQQPAAETDPEPKREQFESYEDHLRAVAKWEARQEFKAQAKGKGESQRESQQQPQQSQPQPHEKAAQEWTKREQAFEKTAKDYTDVVSEYLESESSLSQAARQAILESEVGPKLLYHLGSNAEDAARIEKLSPARQVAELVKLEDKLTKPESKKESAAPPPISQTRHSSSPSNGFREDMSDTDYREMRKAQGARWAQ